MVNLVADTRISSAEFGDYHYQKFLQWSFCDRQSKAALLRNVAVARTDANSDAIEKKLSFYADLYKIPLADLVARIAEADRAGVSIAKLHEELAKAAPDNQLSSE